MSPTQRKHLRLALATVYIIYCGITTFCVHLHIVNGTTYVHHHPNTPHDHNGNLAEVILFSSQSSSIDNITLAELNIAHYFQFIQKINPSQGQSIIRQKRTGSYFLRPPPTHISHLG